MYRETVELMQISGALLGCILLFVSAYAVPVRISIGILLVLIPFQPVATIYGSVNVLMTYVLAGALMIRGRLRYAPMVGAIFAVLFSYLITISQLPKSIYVLHGIEFVALVSGFLVFVLAYNLAREVEDPKFIVNLFIWMDVLSIAYCFIQLTVPPGQSLEFFGFRELALNPNRGDGDARLVGPFGTPGITAAYFMSLTLMLIYEAMCSQARRKILIAVLGALNVGMMIATANRGSFLVLLAGALGLLYLFRAELGFARVVQILVASTILLLAASTIVVTYTNFGEMFARLETTTEFTDGIPTTRAYLWPEAWENIKEKPFLGHGPRILQQHELRFTTVPDEQLVGSYPHNLVLFLLVTVGILGTATMLFFLLSVAWRVYRGARWGAFGSSYERGWVLVGFLVIGAFLVDELKIEFLRVETVDYAHFIFALFGIFLGWADKARSEALASEKVAPSRLPRRATVGDASPAVANRNRA